jgi:hypothetical protein
MVRGSQLERYSPLSHVVIYQTPKATESRYKLFMRSVMGLGNVRIQ